MGNLKEQRDAVKCLRLRFLGNFDEFIPVPHEKEYLAHFLAALSVLTPNASRSQFKMSSPMIDLLIRRRVVPAIYPSAPNTPIPKKYDGGPLDINRAKEYKINSSAGEVWVVHFTREDNYLKHPLWQSNQLLSEGIYVVYVLHDYAFQSVRIGASYMNSNSTIELIKDERVI